jgi:cytochrome P450
MTPAGILQDLMSPVGRADPFPLYAAAHRLGPLLPVTDDIFLVVGYAAVNEVLRNPVFEIPAEPSSQPSLELMQRSILRANPPDHGRMRSLISQVFTPRRVAELQPPVEAAVDELPT